MDSLSHSNPRYIAFLELFTQRLIPFSLLRKPIPYCCIAFLCLGLYNPPGGSPPPPPVGVDRWGIPTPPPLWGRTAGAYPPLYGMLPDGAHPPLATPGKQHPLLSLPSLRRLPVVGPPRISYPFHFFRIPSPLCPSFFGCCEEDCRLLQLHLSPCYMCPKIVCY